MGSRPCNKYTVIVMKHTNMQQSNDVVVPPIPAQQLEMLDEPHKSKLNERKLSPSKSMIEQLVSKSNDEAQDKVTKDTSSVQKKPSEPELACILKNFKEVVTTPLEPLLLQTPSSKSIDKKEGHCRNPKHKIKLKKQKMTTKMTQKILAMTSGFSEVNLPLDELALQGLDPFDKPLSSSALDQCMKLKVVGERKRKKKKKLSFAEIGRKRKKSSIVD
jgi:hypothetical protein